MSSNPTVLLVEDHVLTLAGLRLLLESLKFCEIVGEAADGEAADGEAAVRETQRLRPDVILMDVGLPQMESKPPGESSNYFPKHTCLCSRHTHRRTMSRLLLGLAPMDIARRKLQLNK